MTYKLQVLDKRALVPLAGGEFELVGREGAYVYVGIILGCQLFYKSELSEELTIVLERAAILRDGGLELCSSMPSHIMSMEDCIARVDHRGCWLLECPGQHEMIHLRPNHHARVAQADLRALVAA